MVDQLTHGAPFAHEEAAGAPADAVSATSLTRVFGAGPTEVRALDDVTLAFPSGELTAIMGPSGSGKSTLLHTLGGLDRPDSGAVHIGDTEITALRDRELTRLRRIAIGFVFQEFNLIPSLSAVDNITLPLRLAGDRADPTWLGEVVGIVGLEDRLAHRPHELSGGQQQRVAVARALITRPTVILADEPTGNLDSNSSIEVMTYLQRSVRNHGQTVVMVTHDPQTAAYADRVVFLADGRTAGELIAPTVPAVLERMGALGAIR